MANLSDCALIIAAHGSSVNEESRLPALAHAERIRARNLFAEVHVAFWKEEPHFKDILARVRAEKVFIAPLFISEGYYTQEVLPREFGLAGAVTKKDGRELYYCDPVGVHPYMTEALLKAVQGVLAGTPVDPASTCLFIAGHGTPRNANSTRVIHEQVVKIGALNLYAQCGAVFMEEAPFAKDWMKLTSHPNVIVVPFFIADGLHGYEDMPVLMGMTDDVKGKGFTNPTFLHGRRLWYARAIGAEPRVSEVLLAQVEAFRRRHLAERDEEGKLH